tara:strand:- start:48 stop:302 length:255 start_codon:yes stop_codon:yes gene_type:complete
MSKLFHNDKSKDSSTLFESWSFSKTNYLLFFAGLVLIIFGYIAMGNGEVSSFQSLTLAPTMLFLGYIVFIPSALIYNDRRLKKD